MNIHIPTYEEVCEKDKGERTPIEQFVFVHEPVSSILTNQFRADLHSLIEFIQEQERASK